jgi:CobQ-like glutamine amidotransferase family enzyme
MSASSRLDVVALFPRLLGTYGDRGNATIIQRRCQWRGQDVRLIEVNANDPVPTSGDIYLIGGGEDSSQLAAMTALRGTGKQAGALRVALDAGAQLLAVCAGLQLLGHSFTGAAGTQTPGLGLLDVTTTRLATRAVGELQATPDPALGLPLLTGFENHGGHTVLGPAARPLATVVRGTGNGPQAGGSPPTEGAMSGGILATYLHGPVLARNPMLADLLIARATGVPVADLSPLDVPEHDALRRVVGAGQQRQT